MGSLQSSTPKNKSRPRDDKYIKIQLGSRKGVEISIKFISTYMGLLSTEFDKSYKHISRYFLYWSNLQNHHKQNPHHIHPNQLLLSRIIKYSTRILENKKSTQYQHKYNTCENSSKGSVHFNPCTPILILKAFLIQSIIYFLTTHLLKSPVSNP